VVAVPVSKVLHLKSAVTALPSGELVAWKAGLDQASIEALGEGGKRLITFMPEEAGAHVVALDDKTLLMSSAAPRSISALENRGFRVVPVDITEYEKLEGCVTCLSVRIRE
jgi:dimethylargininase